MKLKIYKTITY